MGIIKDIFGGLGRTKNPKKSHQVPIRTGPEFGTTESTPSGGRKGHSGQFKKAILKRRIRNKIAKASRKANR